jgi:SAM-dependent methyltransferase
MPTLADPGSDTAVVRQQWDAAAQGWNDHAPQIRAWLRQPTEAMLAMAGIGAGQSVLDVAAGAGDQTLDIAARVGTVGRVVASDISPGILQHAARNAALAGFANVETHCADAADLGLAEGTFDAAVCRLGLMFLPDPARALAGIARSLRPGAGFCAMVFAGPDTNPCIRILMTTALRHAGLPPRDPFTPGGLLSLGKPGRMDELLRDAGFRDVATTRMPAPFRLPATADYVAFLHDAAGPIHAILARLDEAARATAWSDMAAQLDTFQTDDGWIGPNELLLTAGRR